MVFVSRRKVIFIHGCFWHAHGRKLTRLPNSNLDYWLPKLRRNRDRDRKSLKALAAAGWHHVVIWECGVQDRNRLESLLGVFLE